MIWNSAVCCVFTCNKQVTGRPPDSISLQIFFNLNSVNYFSCIIVSFLFMLLYLRLLSYLFRFSHTIIIVMHQYTKAYSFVCVILFSNKPISDVFIPVETNICSVYCFFFFKLQSVTLLFFCQPRSSVTCRPDGVTRDRRGERAEESDPPPHSHCMNKRRGESSESSVKLYLQGHIREMYTTQQLTDTFEMFSRSYRNLSGSV